MCENIPYRKYFLLKDGPGFYSGLQGFLEQCRGQAVGSIGKKSGVTGRMKIRDGTTLHDFCDSFR